MWFNTVSTFLDPCSHKHPPSRPMASREAQKVQAAPQPTPNMAFTASAAYGREDSGPSEIYFKDKTRPVLSAMGRLKIPLPEMATTRTSQKSCRVHKFDTTHPLCHIAHQTHRPHHSTTVVTLPTCRCSLPTTTYLTYDLPKKCPERKTPIRSMQHLDHIESGPSFVGEGLPNQFLFLSNVRQGLWWAVGNHFPFHLTARPPTDFNDAWAVVLFSCRAGKPRSRLSEGSQEKTMNNGNCRLACASLLNGVEGFRFFNIRKWLGF